MIKRPDYVFALSWEVCNKVGGIYTVLSTQAKTFQIDMPDHIIYLGPSFGDKTKNTDFILDKTLFPEWKEAARNAGIPVQIGRWNVPGKPIVILVDFSPLFPEKDIIYKQMWEDFNVDSLHAYGDYHEACMFSYAVGKVCEVIAKQCLQKKNTIVLQAHEWMSGFALLYIKKYCPNIATVFTTHATSIGRSITSNNKPLYDYFKGYFGDQMARELCMEAKHSVEKQTAQNTDCMTTVSYVTDAECIQFLERSSDVILPNGFEMDFVPKAKTFTAKRNFARQRMLNIANALLGTKLSNDTVIVSTGGRNDFRCKGFDVLICALRKLQQRELSKDVIAVIAVPCWKEGPRKDLQERLSQEGISFDTPLPDAFITHTLYNYNEDRLVNSIKGYGISTSPSEHLHVILIPSYLDGKDGIVNLPYYDWLIGCDLCLYPSYYEPWGYTCLESIAFGIPCLTTDLAGFGVWVYEVLGREATLNDGVQVIHRSDSNYDETAENIAHAVEYYLQLSKTDIKTIQKKASALAKNAQWKDFIQHYYVAFDKALNNTKNTL